MKNYVKTLNLLLISFSLLFTSGVNPTYTKTPAQEAGVWSQPA
jgi:hypothetical protein